MKWCHLFLSCGLAWNLSAAVSVTQKGDNIILKNDHLEAEIAPMGGNIVRLTNKQLHGINMVGKPQLASAKDQLVPGYVKFFKNKHKLTILKNTPQEAVIRTFIRGTDAYSFVELTKTYTLRQGVARLDIRVDLRNTPESMGDIELAYGSHNYYGVPNGKNMVSLPMATGIKRFIPNQKENAKYNNIPSRGWIGVTDPKGYGAVSLYDLSYSDIAFAWYCGPKVSLHTVEWQLKAVPVPAGETYTVNHAVALTNGLQGYSGAGAAAIGRIEIPEKLSAGKTVNAKIRLYGLVKESVKLKIKLGKAVKELSCQLTPGKITECAVTLPAPAETGFVTCDVLDKQGKKLFDLYEKVQVGDKGLTAEMTDYPARKKITANADVWEIPLDWNTIKKDTEFQWARNSAYKAPNTLILLPTMGVRDAVELARRTNIKVTFPTILPDSWSMAWRDKVIRPGENGLATLPDHMKKSYDLFILGGSFRAKGDTHLDWNKIPASVRANMLKSIHNGASLLYINPTGLDTRMFGILKSLDQGETAKNLLKSFDLQAAPAFDETQIRCGTYGKGKIITIKFPTEKAFLTPSFTKWAGGYNQFIKHRYDYQDYQFGVLAKLVQYLSGAPAEPGITLAEKWDNGVLKHQCSKNAARIQYTVYDRYGNTILSRTIPANEKIVLPALPAGNNRIKLCVLDKNNKVLDLAFKTLNKPAKSILKDVTWAKLPIHAGEQAKGEIKLSAALPEGTSLRVEITDVMGRLIHVSTGKDFVFDTKKSLVLTHELTAKIMKNGNVQEILRVPFHVVGAGQENYYPTMLWDSMANVSDYCAPHLMNVAAEYGFSLLYAGYPNANGIQPLRYSPLEVSTNTFAGLSNVLRTPSVKALQNAPKEKKIRKPCLNDPAIAPRQRAFVKGALDLLKNFGSERYFNMGDEMSITWYSMPIDICFSQYCLPKFREYLKTIYPTLDALNKHWETQFKNWNEVMPMTFSEVLTRENAAPWSTHREFMDKLFADNVNMQADVIRKIFPKGYYGPTGLEGKPHVYGGGSNFEHMRKLTMLSAYGDARIPLSFNRNNRIIMSYRGYKRTEISQFINYWEGLFTGERGANHWFTWSFFQPDYSPAKKREFYRDIIWELRSGIAALMVNSNKFTDEAAILYSHPSVRSNFLKEEKLDVYDNLLSFARYFEDRAMGYRFILPGDLENGTLNKFKVLVLAEATAISAKQAQAIKKFVANGGILLADYETALEDEWNVPLAKGMLDDLLGIRQRSMGFANSKPSAQFNIRKCAKAKAVKGKPQAMLKDALNRQYPILITNKYGKGRSLYLNFRFDYNKQRMQGDDSLRALLDQHLNFQSKYKPVMDLNGKPAGRIMTTFYRNRQNMYIGLLPELPKGNWQKAKPDALKKFSFKAKFTMPAKGWLYNVRTGKCYGNKPVQILDLTPAHAVVLSLLPYRVTGLDVKTSGIVNDIAKIAVSVKTSNGKAGHHVFHMTVKTPDGKTPWYYRQTKETANGSAVFELPLALNAEKGNYEITVTDAATKTSAILRINCKN